MLNLAESMHNLRGIYARFQRNPCTKTAVSMHGMGGIFRRLIVFHNQLLTIGFS